MLLLQYLLAFITASTTVFALESHQLRQATRAQIISRATRSRDLHRRQTSMIPYPKCSDHVSTGTVPYARWSGLDYDALPGAIYTPDVQTREDCIKLCELDKTCLVSTYNSGTKGCYKTTQTGRYFLAPFDATIKGVSCEESTAVIEQYRQATCCTEYRAASPQ